MMAFQSRSLSAREPAAELLRSRKPPHHLSFDPEALSEFLRGRGGVLCLVERLHIPRRQRRRFLTRRHALHDRDGVALAGLPQERDGILIHTDPFLSILDALKKTSKGPQFISETEADLEPFPWKDTRDLTDRHLLQLAGAEDSTEVETMLPDNFLRGGPQRGQARVQ
jgi:hypothetical protein